MKKIVSITLALIMAISLAACGKTANKDLTTDDCLGVWVLESGSGFAMNYSTEPIYCQKMEIVKAGLVKGYKEKDGTTYSEYNWEIEDNALKIYWDATGYGFSAGGTNIFEIDGDTMTAIDGGNSVYVRQ